MENLRLADLKTAFKSRQDVQDTNHQLWLKNWWTVGSWIMLCFEKWFDECRIFLLWIKQEKNIT